MSDLNCAVQTLDSNAFGEGTVLGCDFVGTVEEPGKDAKILSKGDVVAGLIWGAEIKGLGAYGSHTFADDRISFKVPKGVRPEDAATVPLASCTAWLALFSKTCLNIPKKEAKTSILIWGGSCEYIDNQIYGWLLILYVCSECRTVRHSDRRTLRLQHHHHLQPSKL